MPNIVKITTPIHFFDLFAPHSCKGCNKIGYVLCDCCKNYIKKSHQNFCPVCKHPSQSGRCSRHKSLPPTFIVGYRQGLLEQLIHDFKYDSVRALSHSLAELIDYALPKIASPACVVPLPTTSRHIRERGLDHTKRIAKHLVKLRPGWQTQNLLIRAKNTVQVGADRKTRLTQAKLAYKLNPNTKINPDTTYILLDDVWTTGASMLAAVKKLRHGGAKKIIITLLAVSEI